MSPPHNLLAGYIPSDAPAADGSHSYIISILLYTYIFRTAFAKGLQAVAEAASQLGPLLRFSGSLLKMNSVESSSDRADIYRVNCTLFHHDQYHPAPP